MVLKDQAHHTAENRDLYAAQPPEHGMHRSDKSKFALEHYRHCNRLAMGDRVKRALLCCL